MNDRKKLQGLLGPHDCTRLMDAMQRGITRRQMIQLLVAGGMQVTLAGSIASLAGNAHAQTPKKGGRLRVASATFLARRASRSIRSAIVQAT